ncbi:hypothetical protein KZZ08_00505 [Roseovarius mucosus]|uniref:hypothetical protein n=1 Tax=Roseovarius mucosus TaxID=215743 RepID=UPI001C5D757F|nr:hypothetical protein [Roseovarius mucosus]MBW4972076.1 hypothetical protein [Roseovarius mucosus]
MANIHDCLQRAVDAGELDSIRADQAKSEFDQLVERYEQAMPRHQAEQTAAIHLREATQRSQRSRRHAVLTQLQSMVRLKSLIEGAPDPALALRNLIEYSEGAGFTGESIQTLSEAMIKSVNGGMADTLAATRRNLIGNSRDPALLSDIIRELHLEDTGKPRAKELAAAVRHQQKRLRQMFNAHGGDIGDLADFGVSHSHDVAALRKAGFDKWSEAVFARIDWSRIVDTRTGQPFAAAGAAPARADVDAFLTDVWEGITKRGWHKREASMAVGGKAIYNRRAEARVLHFKTGSDWLEYNKEFGTSDPFSAMVAGLHGLARDVAMMRVLGPNPRLGLEYAAQVAEKRVAGDTAQEIRVKKQAGLARTMLAHVDGSVNNTDAEGWARFFSNTRKIITSQKLGSAILSAVSDTATISVAARMVGMNPANVLSRATRLMASNATRQTAARMGYVADTLADAGSAAARFTGDTVSGELAERLSGFTIRASGLSFWTDMNKLAFQMEFAGFMADNAPRAFDAIDEPLRRIFEQRGISAADWDLLRNPETLFVTDSGADFLSPFHWLEHQTTVPRAEAEGLALRLQMAIEEQLERAVPSASIEGRARFVGNTQPGTIPGELLRSSTMFKSFALSLTLGQYRRFMAIPTPMGRAKYAAAISTGLFVTGALALQLKEVAKGRDPRPMDSLAFAGAAALQGGGLGIFGDFLSAETNRFGGGFAQTLAGPVVDFASSVANPILSNASRAATGEDTMLGRDAANFIRFNTPVASSLWPTRVAFDRLVADQLQLFLDPSAEELWRRQERQRERDFGTGIWWDRASPVPTRAPDIANAFGGSGQ